MFCPNCGKENFGPQKYCRACGLELEEIMRALAGLEPANSRASLQRRKELFDKLGVVSLTAFALLGFSYFFYKVIYYKLLLFGAGVLEGFALAFLFIFAFLTAFFFNSHRIFGGNSANPHFPEHEKELGSKVTEKLLEEKFMEPAAGSVTESSTELLGAEIKTRKIR